MSRLIIVAGAGGAGKSFFLRLWERHDGNSCRIKKFVSEKRSPRKIEIETGDSDLIFSECYDPSTKEGAKWYKENIGYIPKESKLTYHNKKYDLSSKNNLAVYNYNGTYYEVDMESIKMALEDNKNPIVIVRKCETIKKLLDIYPNALVIYVQSILSGEDLVGKLINLGESEDDARKRQNRNYVDLQDYVESIQQLPNSIRVVVNDFNESDNGTVFAQIEDIYQEEIVNYHFKENSIFVIQSYLNSEQAESNLNIIKKAAKRAMKSVDIDFVTQADMRKDGSYEIPSHVWDSIDSSDCIICDVTSDRCCSCESVEINNSVAIKKKFKQGTSTNVWLELGYAIARMRFRNIDLGKRLIIVSNNDTIIPVDLGGSSLRVIKYTDKFSLANQIETELLNMFNN